MSLRHALLGFLSLRKLTGYDLKKYFDSSVRHFWAADQAQIYRTLSQLADDGLVEIDVVAQDGRPDRKEHRLTAAGVAALDAWLRSPEESQPTREPFLVKVFFAGRLPPDEVISALDTQIAATQGRLRALQGLSAEVAATLPTGPHTPVQLLTLATLENRIRHLLTELVWLQDLRYDLEHIEADEPRVWRHLRLDLGAG